GGSLENRMRFVLELFSAVRKEWGGVLGVRLSASDWIENGWSLEESVELTQRLKLLGCDYIHVSSLAVSPLNRKFSWGLIIKCPLQKRLSKKPVWQPWRLA
ncbi:MAG: hypothetical protein RIR08_229, partial [Pseudomonadota bacterium]